MKLNKIISGGQTGVDRGALDAAISRGIEHGGWCPSGRRAEDGPIPGRYHLKEHWSSSYPPRTALNVKDADATLLLILGKHVSVGSRLTARLARDHKSPWRAINLESPQAVQQTLEWLRETAPAILNVAGPRESKFRGIQRTTSAFMRMVIDSLREK